MNPPPIPTLGLQIAQSRPYLHTLGPKVGIAYIIGAPGQMHTNTGSWEPVGQGQTLAPRAPNLKLWS